MAEGDLSEYRTPWEHPYVQQLQAARVRLMIGTSSDRQKIMHEKYFVVDRAITLSGSYNFIDVAGEESNFADIVTSPTRAGRFLADWQRQGD